MEQNKIALFDIDYTIFNASGYRNLFQRALYKELGNGETLENFIRIADEAYAQSKKQVGHFDPQLLVKLLGEKLNVKINVEDLTKIVINEDLIQNSLYEESIDVFRKLSTDKTLTLGIFSGGRIDLQTSKIRSIEEFLHKEHIHIFEFEKWTALPDLLRIYSKNKLYIIDDVLTILHKAKTLYNTTTTIWIKRGVYKDKHIENFTPDFTIENLNEVLPILLE